MSKYAIIVAGGSGTRMHSDVPKQFLELDGLPVLMQTIKRFYDADPDTEIILVIPDSHFEYWQQLIDQYKFDIKHVLVPGGQTRFHSVKHGLNAIENHAGLVAIHDGVRPLVTEELISNSYNTAQKYGNAVAAVDLKESLRQTMERRNKAVPRNQFKIVQTPQTFRLEIIKPAFDIEYADEITDDAGVVERYGEPIRLIEGSYENIKITTPEDLILAEALIKKQKGGK